MDKTMKVWTIAMLVLGVLTIGVLGMITFAPSPTSTIILYILMGFILVVGAVGPIVNEKWKFQGRRKR